jgi:hypothetical protein
VGLCRCREAGERGQYQKWDEIKDTAGWRLKNKATGLTLGQNGSVLCTGFDGGLKAQRWR